MRKESFVLPSLIVGSAALLLAGILSVFNPPWGRGGEGNKGNGGEHNKIQTQVSFDTLGIATLNYPTVPFVAGRFGTILKKTDMDEGVSVADQITYYKDHPTALQTTTTAASPIVTATSSFTIGARELLNYLEDIKRYAGCTYIHLILGENQTAKKLSLYIAGVLPQKNAAKGNHCYIFDGTDKKVLKCTTNTVNFDPAGLPAGLPASVMKNCADFDNKLISTTADAMYAEYAANIVQVTQPRIKNANSYKLNVTTLALYIANILSYRPDYQSEPVIEFFLGQDFGRVTLMVCGQAMINGAVKRIYLSPDGNNGYLLEHCHPCPTCEDIVDNGRSLE